jgi:signal peptidase I
LALSTLKKWWKNEYFQTAIMIAIMLGIVFGFWYGVQWGLHTEYPGLAVASQSMEPTLNVGDLIVVQGTPATQIYANYLNGDIIVFRRPFGDPTELIVHRAVVKEWNGTNWLFTTKGDNNAGADPQRIPDDFVIGKVIGKIPWIGNFALLTHTRENMFLFIIIIIILIVLFLTLPFGGGKEENTDQNPKPKEKRKLFGRFDLKVVYLLILNVILIIFLVLSLWGALTFWQPGANPGQNVTIYGMYSDAQFHEGFTVSYNDVQQIYLSSGFLTYTINTYASDSTHVGLRLGVPALSWAQAAVILLLIVDVWELVKFILSKRKAKSPAPET